VDVSLFSIKITVLILLFFLLFITFISCLQQFTAMAAHTPVSALVHSSTLVTAGVYLSISFSPALSNSLCIFFLLFSSLTIFMAGLGANFEYDLRRIIALSTLR
jgi:NADH:ubiquinone oxidoreductase subunit 5 (subunit L)/multisubunit Na+/H+ antiporter MnhA subunit